MITLHCDVVYEHQRKSPHQPVACSLSNPKKVTPDRLVKISQQDFKNEATNILVNIAITHRNNRNNLRHIIQCVLISIEQIVIDIQPIRLTNKPAENQVGRWRQ